MWLYFQLKNLESRFLDALISPNDADQEKMSHLYNALLAVQDALRMNVSIQVWNKYLKIS